MTPKQYRRLREKAKLTQQELGNRVGVWANTIARRERGERPISKEAAAALLWVTR